MTVPLYQVDAFAEDPFLGNPAGVCLLDERAEPGWMQLVAREMNLSETAFLVPQAGTFELRWFTPIVEVDLCGHATLASAHVLWETGRLADREPALFDTASGRLVARRRDGCIEMDFPASPDSEVAPPPALLGALGADARYVGRSRHDYLVELESESDVRGLAPDFAALRDVPSRGVIVTSVATTPGFDFVSRFFGPAVGVDEDPVTGSAHCCLSPFWAARLDRADLVGYQASARGGIVHVRFAGDRVAIGGTAVTVFRGELLA